MIDRTKPITKLYMSQDQFDYYTREDSPYKELNRLEALRRLMKEFSLSLPQAKKIYSEEDLSGIVQITDSGGDYSTVIPNHIYDNRSTFYVDPLLYEDLHYLFQEVLGADIVYEVIQEITIGNTEEVLQRVAIIFPDIDKEHLREVVEQFPMGVKTYDDLGSLGEKEEIASLLRRETEVRHSFEDALSSVLSQSVYWPEANRTSLYIYLAQTLYERAQDLLTEIEGTESEK